MIHGSATCLGQRDGSGGDSKTHEVSAYELYAADFGGRAVPLPRSAGELTADVEALLAACLEHDDLDLAAELLWTWPVLDLPWSPAATFAFVARTLTAPDGLFYSALDLAPD